MMGFKNWSSKSQIDFLFKEVVRLRDIVTRQEEDLRTILGPRKRLRRAETPAPHKDGKRSHSEASQGGSSGGESETSDSEESILSLEEGCDCDPEEDRDEESRQMAPCKEKQEEAKVEVCEYCNHVYGDDVACLCDS